EDYTAFAGDVGGIEYGIEDQVTENVEGDGHVFVENLDVEADTLFGGEGVHVAADGIHLAGDLFGGAVLGPFEDHVLDGTGDAVRFRVFVARSGLQPDADRGGANMLHLLGDNGEADVQ